MADEEEDSVAAAMADSAALPPPPPGLNQAALEAELTTIINDFLFNQDHIATTSNNYKAAASPPRSQRHRSARRYRGMWRFAARSLINKKRYPCEAQVFLPSVIPDEFFAASGSASHVKKTSSCSPTEIPHGTCLHGDVWPPKHVYPHSTIRVCDSMHPPRHVDVADYELHNRNGSQHPNKVVASPVLHANDSTKVFPCSLEPLIGATLSTSHEVGSLEPLIGATLSTSHGSTPSTFRSHGLTSSTAALNYASDSNIASSLQHVNGSTSSTLTSTLLTLALASQDLVIPHGQSKELILDIHTDSLRKGLVREVSHGKYSCRKPPRPPRSAGLRSNSFRSIRLKSASRKAMLENARMKKRKATKSSSRAPSFLALIFSLAFLLIMLFQVFSGHTDVLPGLQHSVSLPNDSSPSSLST